ncbi:hypothetical protein AAHC03_022998 [Spirometra sp. Aus1]
MEKFRDNSRTARITQYLAPEGHWPEIQRDCIEPKLSMPLIRNATEGTATRVQCAISKKRCEQKEDVIIFDLDRVFCEYKDDVRTCERKELDKDTVIFTATVSNSEANAYYPDQYVFCNAMGSYMSVRLVWTKAPSPEEFYPISDGLKDNVITSRDSCIWATVQLPEKLTNIAVDELSLSCDEKLCKALGDKYLKLEYEQKKVGSHYLVNTNICEPEKYFRLGYEMEKFRDNSRTARITQYLAPEGHWPEIQTDCIIPQLSMPLVRNLTEGTTVTVQCAISKERSYGLEEVVIFDLNQVFCENSETVHTCERRELDKDTVIFTATVSNSKANTYYPEQYVFCNAMGSYMSIKLVWIKDTSSKTTEEFSTERTSSQGSLSSVQPHIKISDGLEDNVVTSTGKCIWTSSYLPEPLTNLAVDELRYNCYGGMCKAPGDRYYEVEYTQQKGISDLFISMYAI